MNGEPVPHITTAGTRSAAARRYLVVNADDFGQSSGINQGIIDAHEHGVVTSASLMVRWPAARAAARYALSHPELSVGLHLDLGEWEMGEDGWSQIYEVVPLDDRDALRGEIKYQLRTFISLVGRNPSHIDSHQHVHRRSYAAEIVRTLGVSLRVPVRHFTRAVCYQGGFYGQSGHGDPYPEGISVRHFVEMLRCVPAGVTEMACHPGYAGNLKTMYAAERETEVRTLCDGRLSAALESEGIILTSFNDDYVRATIDGAEDS